MLTPTGRPSTTTRHLSVLVLALALVLPLLGLSLPAAAQSGPFDGDPATTERIDAGDPVTAAIGVSQGRFAGTAPYAVLATADTFADSLAGAALTADGPLLLTAADSLNPATADELDRVLDPGATVYVLGGVAAIGQPVQAAIADAGFVPQRLAGETRIETALSVADAVRQLNPDGTSVLLARADASADNPTAAWADSLTGGSLAAATGLPILITPTAGTADCTAVDGPCDDVQLGLHPDVEAWLTTDQPTQIVLLGGEAALSELVEQAAQQIAATTRLAGPERTATAAAIADSPLWTAVRGQERRFLIVDGGRPDGWAYGLSAAGIAADTGAPPLMVVGGLSASTRRLVSTCGDADVDLLLAGDATVISDEVLDTLNALDGSACANEFTALNRFGDCSDTLGFFIAQGLDRVGPYGLDEYWYGGIAVEEVAFGPTEEGAQDDGGAPAPVAQPVTADGDAAGGGDVGDEAVSETNVQEQGVDEPDRVKATASAIYTATGDRIEVTDIDTSPPASAGNIVIEPLSDGLAAYGTELLLDGDVLVALTTGDGFVYPTAEPAPDVFFAPQPYFPEPVTIVTRYDVSEPLDPTPIDVVEYDGAYRSARMVDGVIRLVTSANPTGLDFVFPESDASGNVSDSAIQTAIDHNTAQVQASTLTDWLPTYDDGTGPQPLLDCADVFAPPGFSGITTVSVASIDVSESASPTSSAAVIAQGETIYASTERLVVSTTEWGRSSDGVQTLVHSFDISDPEATAYVASGSVPGYVLSSYSISERDGYYRIATSTQPNLAVTPLPAVEGDPIPVEPDGGIGDGAGSPDEPAVSQPTFTQSTDTLDNGVTILTEGGGELFEVGSVFGLGEGEQIFAVRFLGDIAAVVTFRQVDPLYLVDLSDPAAPRVTGELKIPGVSRYLHPVSEDLLLGVGQDGTDDGQLTGLQVSLFDISDRTAPTRIDTIEYGPGDSPVEFDPRAFLYWNPLDRAFVPANLYEAGRYGVEVLDVDVEAGTLTTVGTMQDGVSGEFSGIDRTVIVGDTAYAISFRGISAHDLDDLTARGFAPFDDGADGGEPMPVEPDGGIGDGAGPPAEGG